MALWVPIGINNAAFKSGLNEMRGQAKAFSGEIKNMFASAFAAGAIIAGFRQWMQEMDRVQKLGQRFGETAETIQRVSLSASLAGGDIELVTKATSKLTVAASQAEKGNAALAEQFSELGINAAEFVGMSMEQKLLALSQAYQDAEGSGSKMTTLMELLGGRAQDLIPLLAQGPAALKESFDSATVASQGTVDQIAAFNDSLELLKNKASVVFIFVIKLFNTVGETIGKLIGYGIVQFDTIKNAALSMAKGVADAFKALAKGDFDGVGRALKGNFEIAKRATGDWWQTSMTAIEDIKSGTADIWFPPNAESAPQKLADDFDDLKKKLDNLHKEIADIEQRNREAAMSDEERLQAMIERRNELLTKANDITEKGLLAKKEALELEGKIEEAQRQADKRKADGDKQLADKLQAAKEAEAAVDEKNKVDIMSPEEKRAFFADKQKELFKKAEAAAKSGDELKATQLRTEAKGLEDEIRAESRPDKKSPSITATSLASVGGGGYVQQTATDPLLRAQEKGNFYLERIARAVESVSNENTEQPPVK